MIKSFECTLRGFYLLNNLVEVERRVEFEFRQNRMNFNFIHVPNFVLECLRAQKFDDSIQVLVFVGKNDEHGVAAAAVRDAQNFRVQVLRVEVVVVASAFHERFVTALAVRSLEGRRESLVERSAPSALEVHRVDKKDDGVVKRIFSHQVLDAAVSDGLDPPIDARGRVAGVGKVELLNVGQVVVLDNRRKSLNGTDILVDIHLCAEVDCVVIALGL